LAHDAKVVESQWYLLTVIKSGGNPAIRDNNLLRQVENPGRGAILVEPFPWTVTQGVILVLLMVNNQLYVVALGVPTEITTLEPWWVR